MINRRPRGTPAGGQFAVTERPEVDFEASESLAPVRGQVSAFATAKGAEASDQADQLNRVAEEAEEDRERHLARARGFAAAAVEKRKAGEEALRQLDSAPAGPPLIGWLRRSGAKRRAKSQIAAGDAADGRAAAEIDAAANRWNDAEAAKVAASAALESAGRMSAGVEAEQAVVDTLRRTPGVDHVVCGIDLGPGIGDVDVVAFGRRVVLVEVKAGGGELEAGPDGSVTHGGRPTPKNPLAQCAGQAEALGKVTGVNVTRVVCFPHAERSHTFHPESGCHLIGGRSELSSFVAEEMARGGSADPQDPNHFIHLVNNQLIKEYHAQNKSLAEVTEKDNADRRRVADWNRRLAESASWSPGWAKGPEIRAGWQERIASATDRIAWRASVIDKIAAKRDSYRASIEKNKELVRR